MPDASSIVELLERLARLEAVVAEQAALIEERGRLFSKWAMSIEKLQLISTERRPVSRHERHRVGRRRGRVAAQVHLKVQVRTGRVSR